MPQFRPGWRPPPFDFRPTCQRNRFQYIPRRKLVQHLNLQELRRLPLQRQCKAWPETAFRKITDHAARKQHEPTVERNSASIRGFVEEGECTKKLHEAGTEVAVPTPQAVPFQELAPELRWQR